MAWRIAIAAFLLAWVTEVPARHSSSVLNPRKASPGLRLQLVEVPATASGGAIRYSLRTQGFPPGVIFGVLTKDFGRDFQETISGIRFDPSGAATTTEGSGLRRELDRIEIDPGPYPRGAAWGVALTSDDHKLAAFARVIPYPIQSRDGPCTVSLELISLYGNRFVASGSGFLPGEDVRVESTSAGRATYRALRVLNDGSLPSDVVSHGAI